MNERNQSESWNGYSRFGLISFSSQPQHRRGKRIKDDYPRCQKSEKTLSVAKVNGIKLMLKNMPLSDREYYKTLGIFLNDFYCWKCVLIWLKYFHCLKDIFQ